MSTAKMNKKSCLLVFSIIFSSLLSTIFANIEIIHINSTESLNENTSSELEPDIGICELINHAECEQYELLPSQHNDLRTRKCMCDEYCATYKDCCNDSSYYNESQNNDEKFVCSYTSYDGFIYKLSKCPLNYTNEKIIYYCETNNETTLLEDVTLIIPVVNEAKRITYKNVFCAFCNNDTQVEFWGVVLHFKLMQNIDTISSNFSGITNNENEYNVNSDVLLNNLKMDPKQMNLISEFAGLKYKCEINAKMPIRLNSSARYCRPQIPVCNACETNCSNVTTPDIQNTFVVNLTDSRLPNINHCDHLLPKIDQNIKKYICVSSFPTGVMPVTKEENIEYCFVENKTGNLCLVNSVYELGSEFKYGTNNTVYVYTLEAEFDDREWELTSNNNTIYVCGKFIPMSKEKKFYHFISKLLSKTLVKFSIVCLILTIFASKKNLQSILSKIIFSLCLIQLALYLLFEITQLLKDCKIVAAVQHYLLLSCLVWLLIGATELYLMICSKSSTVETHTKRYLVYSFFGWISPLSIMAVAVYFELASNSKISCMWKPGYGRLGQCLIAQEKAKFLFLYFPSSVIFGAIIILFGLASIHIYKSESSFRNNYYILFAELTVFMILTGMLGVLVIFYDVLLFHLVFEIFNASQGVLMFLAYDPKKKIG